MAPSTSKDPSSASSKMVSLLGRFIRGKRSNCKRDAPEGEGADSRAQHTFRRLGSRLSSLLLRNTNAARVRLSIFPARHNWFACGIGKLRHNQSGGKRDELSPDLAGAFPLPDIITVSGTLTHDLQRSRHFCDLSSSDFTGQSVCGVLLWELTLVAERLTSD